MTTENRQRQISAIGAKLSSHDSVSVGRALPIFNAVLFRPNFTVNNWIEIPNYERGSFEGEDEAGWGTHVDATVDCLNVANMKRYDLRKISLNPQTAPEENWANLWQIQASLTEKRLARSDRAAAYRLFLERNIVRVTVDFESNFFIPDPLLHDIWIPLDLNQTSPREGALGKVVLKRQLTDAIKKARRAKFGLPSPSPERAGPVAKVGRGLWNYAAGEYQQGAEALKSFSQIFFGL